MLESAADSSAYPTGLSQAQSPTVSWLLIHHESFTAGRITRGEQHQRNTNHDAENEPGLETTVENPNRIAQSDRKREHPQNRKTGVKRSVKREHHQDGILDGYARNRHARHGDHQRAEAELRRLKSVLRGLLIHRFTRMSSCPSFYPATHFFSSFRPAIPGLVGEHTRQFLSDESVA